MGIISAIQPNYPKPSKGIVQKSICWFSPTYNSNMADFKLVGQICLIFTKNMKIFQIFCHKTTMWFWIWACYIPKYLCRTFYSKNCIDTITVSVESNLSCRKNTFFCHKIGQKIWFWIVVGWSNYMLVKTNILIFELLPNSIRWLGQIDQSLAPQQFSTKMWFQRSQRLH